MPVIPFCFKEDRPMNMPPKACCSGCDGLLQAVLLVHCKDLKFGKVQAEVEITRAISCPDQIISCASAVLHGTCRLILI